MSSQSEKKFLEFDWSNSKEWQAYLSQLYPTPPQNRILKWKKKWYKNNVDPEFDLDSKLGEEEKQPSSSSTTTTTSTPQTASSSAPRQSSQTSPAAATRSNANPLAVNATAALRVAAVLISVYYSLPFGAKTAFRRAVYLHITSNLVSIYCDHGFEASQAWMQRAMLSDSALSLFFSIAAMPFDGFWLMLVSPSMTAVLGLAEVYEAHLKHLIPAAVDRALKLTDGTQFLNNQRWEMLQARANTEVLVGILGFLQVAVGRASALSLLLYWNALRSAYQASGYTKTTFINFHAVIVDFLSKPFMPTLLLTGYSKFAGALHGFANPPRAA